MHGEARSNHPEHDCQLCLRACVQVYEVRAGTADSHVLLLACLRACWCAGVWLDSTAVGHRWSGGAAGRAESAPCSTCLVMRSGPHVTQGCGAAPNHALLPRAWHTSQTAAHSLSACHVTGYTWLCTVCRPARQTHFEDSPTSLNGARRSMELAEAAVAAVLAGGTVKVAAGKGKVGHRRRCHDAANTHEHSASDGRPVATVGEHDAWMSTVGHDFVLNGHLSTESPSPPRPSGAGGLEDCPEPSVFLIEYTDGFRAATLMLDGYLSAFAYAGRDWPRALHVPALLRPALSVAWHRESPPLKRM